MDCTQDFTHFQVETYEKTTFRNSLRNPKLQDRFLDALADSANSKAGGNMTLVIRQEQT